MPSLTFQPNLIDAVMRGTKPGTVRQVRQRQPIKPGDSLHLFTGMRTPKCKRHGEHTCIKVYPIAVDWKKKTITLDGVELIPIIRHWFACTDIQGSEQDFFDFFEKMKYKRPLVYICWSHTIAESIDEWLIDQRRVNAIERAVLTHFVEVVEYAKTNHP